jgi:hypothetical protein
LKIHNDAVKVGLKHVAAHVLIRAGHAVSAQRIPQVPRDARAAP